MAKGHSDIVKAVASCFVLMADVVGTDINYPGGDTIPEWIEAVEIASEAVDSELKDGDGFDAIDVDLEDIEDTVAAVVDAIIELQALIDETKHGK